MDFHKNFVVGDHVVVGEIDDIKSCCHSYSNEMLEFAGMETVIRSGGNGNAYFLEIDDGVWAWCDRCLFPAQTGDCIEIEIESEDLFALLGN